MPDFSDFDLGLFLSPVPVLPLQTARGCSWRRCAFCAHHTTYAGRYRPLPLETVVTSIRRLRERHGATHFTLHDEELPPAHARRLAAALLEAGLDVRLNAYGRLVEGFDDAATVGALHRAGLRSVEWGLESGSSRVLHAMRKGTVPATMSAVLRRFGRAGIVNQCFVVVGFPGESRAEADETAAFLRAHADVVNNLLVNLFHFEPTSPLGRDPAAWGLTKADDGGWLALEGMQAPDAIAYLRRLQADMALNASSFVADLDCVPWGNDGRMVRFVAASLGAASLQTAAGGRDDAAWRDLYPVVLGEVTTMANGVALRPVVVTESPFVNRVRPPDPVPLDDLTHAVTLLCDGTATTGEVLRRATACAPDEARAMAFVRDRLVARQAVAFSRPWPASPGRRRP